MSEIDLAKFVENLARQTHASTAMLLSARLEQALQWIIEGNMPNLSNRTKLKLFDGMGPLSPFSAKIDVAFALGLITTAEKQILHAIRIIRNEFAHSDDPTLSFDHGSMATLLAKLPKPRGLYTSNLHLFTQVASECADALQIHLDKLDLIKSVRNYAEKRKA